MVASTRAARSTIDARRASTRRARLGRPPRAAPSRSRTPPRRRRRCRATRGRIACSRISQNVQAGAPRRRKLFRARQPLVPRPDPDRRQRAVEVDLVGVRPRGDVARGGRPRSPAAAPASRPPRSSGERTSRRVQILRRGSGMRRLRGPAPGRAARRTAPHRRSAIARLEARGSSDPLAAGEQHRHRVLVGVEADPGRADVVGDDGVTPLLDQLGRGPADQRRRRLRSRRRSQSGRDVPFRRARASPARRSGTGASVSASSPSRRESLPAAARGGTEVGHGGRHHDHVGVGRRRGQRRSQLGGRLELHAPGPGPRGRPGPRDQRDRRAPRGRRGRQRRAHLPGRSVADEAHVVDRLARRPGGDHHPPRPRSSSDGAAPAAASPRPGSPPARSAAPRRPSRRPARPDRGPRS